MPQKLTFIPDSDLNQFMIQLMIDASTTENTDIWQEFDISPLLDYDNNPPSATVEMKINGHEIDFVKFATNFIKRCDDVFEKEVTKKAIEMLTKTKLGILLDAIKNADWQIRDALKEAGLKDVYYDEY